MHIIICDIIVILFVPKIHPTPNSTIRYLFVIFPPKCVSLSDYAARYNRPHLTIYQSIFIDK
jgi:hypothetical protein